MADYDWINRKPQVYFTLSNVWKFRHRIDLERSTLEGLEVLALIRVFLHTTASMIFCGKKPQKVPTADDKWTKTSD